MYSLVVICIVAFDVLAGAIIVFVVCLHTVVVIGVVIFAHADVTGIVEVVDVVVVVVVVDITSIGNVALPDAFDYVSKVFDRHAVVLLVGPAFLRIFVLDSVFIYRLIVVAVYRLVEVLRGACLEKGYRHCTGSRFVCFETAYRNYPNLSQCLLQESL